MYRPLFPPLRQRLQTGGKNLLDHWSLQHSEVIIKHLLGDFEYIIFFSAVKDQRQTGYH